MKPQACCITVLLFAICGALIATPAQPARENQAKMAAPGIVLHLDAAAVADAAKEGPIAVWSDRSGAGNDVRQPDQARRPGLDLTAGPDGKPAVVFNGGQWLDGPPAWKAGSKNLTMVAVWKVTPPAGQPVGAYSIVEQAGNEMKGSGRAALLTVRERYGFNGESNDAHDMAPVAPNQWTLSILTINEKGIVRLNHNGVTAKARYDAGSYALDATRLRVGAKASTSGERLIGAIAEIMLFDRVLDEDEISRLEADLIRKHGIARSQIKLADRSTRKSKAPKYSYAETLSEQVAQLEEDPFIKRFAESREELAADRYRPIYHFVSPEHVMNDPNGLCYWQDRWHLFYQGYPPEDPRQHWGHAVSDDLIHWRDLPYAIYPDPEECCFSGSTLVEDDRVIAMYHGTGAGAGTMVAVADDPLLLNWEKAACSTRGTTGPHATRGSGRWRFTKAACVSASTVTISAGTWSVPPCRCRKVGIMLSARSTAAKCDCT
jgi:hypothetical protein